MQILDRHGPYAVALFFLGLGIVYASRVVWRDLVIPIRDKIIDRVAKFFDKLIESLDRGDRFNVTAIGRFERQEEIEWRTHDKVHEIGETVDLMAAKILGPRERKPRKPRSSQLNPAAPSPTPHPPVGAGGS